MASLRFVIDQLSSLLLTTFPVSNLHKIRGLMEFAKSEPPEQAVFTPADIALVEHTLGQIDQAKADSDKLSQAFREFKMTVRARGANDLFYSSPINFLTGSMRQTFSPIGKEIKNDVKKFYALCDKLNRSGVLKSDGASDRLALKLNITAEDTPEILEAKKNLGSAAIILGKYAEKGIQSGIHPKLLIGDSRDDMMRNTLSTIYSAIIGIFTGKATKDLKRDKDPFFAKWARKRSVFEERYERCREAVDKLFNPSTPNSAKTKARSDLVRELKIIVGLRKDADSPGKYNGVLGAIIRRYPQLEPDRNRYAAYAKELVDMTVQQLEYNNALDKAKEQYNQALESIDILGLPDDIKEEFITLPDRLFDPVRQKHVASSIRNAARLAKYLFRRDLSRVYHLTDSMDAALSREMLKVAGVIRSPLYQRVDDWLAENRSDDPDSNRLEDLVSALPDARDTARTILSKDPDLIRELLGEYKTSDDEALKKVDSFRNIHEFSTREELLSKHNPEYRAINDEIYRFMKSLDGYDPAVGFTPEQRAYLYENGWYNDWFKANSSTRGYADYLEDWALNGDGNKETKFDNFKPQQYMIDNLLAIMRKGMLDKQFPEDKLLDRNKDLGEDIAREIQDAPLQSRLISPDWATNKYTARLGNYTLDEDGQEQMAADLEGDPVQTKVTLLYKAFKDQHISTKAYVLLDHFVMDEVGGPVEGEVPVANA